MSPCNHEQFKARVSVQNPRDCKDDPTAGYSASITLRCGICGESFVFVGVSPEPSTERPMVANAGKELRIPVMPVSEVKEEYGGLIQ